MPVIERPMTPTTTLTPTVRLNLEDVEAYLAGKRNTWVSDDAAIEYVDLSTSRIEF